VCPIYRKSERSTDQSKRPNCFSADHINACISLLQHQAIDTHLGRSRLMSAPAFNQESRLAVVFCSHGSNIVPWKMFRLDLLSSDGCACGCSSICTAGDLYQQAMQRAIRCKVAEQSGLCDKVKMISSSPGSIQMNLEGMAS
jgi:hypothetical protein